MESKKKLAYAALLAVQPALLGLVPKNLRALILACTDMSVDLLFYCHGSMSESEKTLFTIDIEGEFGDMMAGYIIKFFGPDAHVAGKSCVIQLDAPIAVPKTGYLAYKRYEPGKFDRNDYLFPENFKQDCLELYPGNIRPIIFLAAQKALLNRVEENLQKVSIAYDDDGIWCYFYYSNTITELNQQLAQEASSELISYFPNHTLHFKILQYNPSERYDDYVKSFEGLKLQFVEKSRERDEKFIAHYHIREVVNIMLAFLRT